MLIEATHNGYTISAQTYKFIQQDIANLAEVCHGAANAAGWWDKFKQIDDPEIRSWYVAARICLAHSELSEAMEGHRKSTMDDHLPHRQMFEVELADALIRIFDLAGGLKIDLAGAFAEKLHYNQTRKDHTREARAEDGGKKY